MLDIFCLFGHLGRGYVTSFCRNPRLSYFYCVVALMFMSFSAFRYCGYRAHLHVFSVDSKW